jgi:hypothetical protein
LDPALDQGAALANPASAHRQSLAVLAIKALGRVQKLKSPLATFIYRSPQGLQIIRSGPC